MVIATILINVVAVSVLTFTPWSDWRTGAALNVVDNLLLVGFTLVRRDVLLARFLLFGVVVGVTELVADACAGRVQAHPGLFHWRRSDDLAFAALDARPVRTRRFVMGNKQ